jgi:hypothetical protein
MIRNTMLTGLMALALGFSACEATEKQNTATSATTTTTEAERGATAPAAPKSSLSEANTGKLMDLMASYYEVKDALVKTDAPRASQTASKLMSAAEMLNHDLSGSDTAIYARVHPSFEAIMNSSEAITNTKDETCEKQRAEFEKTSTALYSLLKEVNLESGRVFQQYCPMAFNDKGAYWLSNAEEIANPYLPKKMLHCGEVRDTL